MTVLAIQPLSETADTVVLSRQDWNTVHDLLEDLRDGAEIEEVRQRLAAGETEDVPWSVAKRLLAGETPVRVWREFRGLTLSALATACGVSLSYLSEIETGKKPGSFEAMAKIARALNTPLEALAPPDTGDLA